MTGPSINRRQLIKLHILLKEVGITDRREQLAYYERVVCEPVSSSTLLSYTHAGWVIDDLERFQQDLPNYVGRAATK